MLKSKAPPIKTTNLLRFKRKVCHTNNKSTVKYKNLPHTYINNSSDEIHPKLNTHLPTINHFLRMPIQIKKNADSLKQFRKVINTLLLKKIKNK